MPESKSQPTNVSQFIKGGGIMGVAIRQKDWSKTPLGPIESWPQSLRTTVSLCLASNFPINLIWGPGHVQIYNDGYRPICAGKHPKSLGEDYTQTWASAWDILSEAFERALTGETSYLENQRMFLDRNGHLEETFFTFSLSPIREETGEIGGLFHPVTETTTQMLSQRRTRALQDLGELSGQAKTVQQACELAVSALSHYQADLPFVLVYRLDDKQAHLAASAHLTAGSQASPDQIELEHDTAWPLAEALATGVACQVNDLDRRFGDLRCGPYAESPRVAWVLPVGSPGSERPAGLVIAAVSPRLPFTEEYRAFIELVGAGLTGSILNARAYDAERIRAEELAELDKAKTVFFSNVSHEFRTPLTLMLGPLEKMLASGDRHLAVEREAIDLVHRNSLRLLRLVNTLLEFSRIEANRVEASYQATDRAGLTHEEGREVVMTSKTAQPGVTRQILLADDNQDMREYIQNILAPEFQVHAVHNGAMALEAMKKFRPDLVLTDVVMPELDGFGLLRALRSDPKTRTIPVIMLSARAGEEARVDGLHAGADDYLVKPFHSRELLARVRVNLELADLRREATREEERQSGAVDIKHQWHLLDTALSHTPDSIYLFNPAGRLMYGNQALLDRWQISFQEAEGKTLLELGYPAEMARQLGAQMEEVIAAGTSIRGEASVTGANGKTHIYDYVFKPVFAGNVIQAVAGSSRDVTDFRETNAALQQANLDLQQFAYSASHDLQEPLRMVTVYCQLLKKKYESRLDERADVIIQHCVNGATRMQAMITDLLAYTRAFEVSPAPREAESLDDAFDQARESLTAVIREAGATVSRESLPRVKVEAVHLRQIFTNLLRNALEYRAERPLLVRVTARRDFPYWVIAVEDNGIGIDPRYQEQIFGLFKRLHTRSQHAGTGLGLSTCKKLLEQHGGRLWLESELGKGSTFLFSLPMDESSAPG